MKNYKANKPCVVCEEGRDGYVTFHHIYTRKSFPEYEKAPWNLIPVCQGCHNNFHSKGNIFMAERYQSVWDWLELNRWEIFNGKLIHRD